MAYFETKHYPITHKTYLPYFGIWHILKYGIFWNMEYFGIWNILELNYSKYFQNLSVTLKNKKIKHLFKLSHNLCSRFWNMESFVIWNILQYGIFWNIVVRKIFKSYPSY